MADVTLEKVLEEAKALTPHEREILLDALQQSVIRPRKTIEQIAKEQGKKPINFAELRKLGRFFPEDENIDDLVQTVREWRNEPGTWSLD